MAFTSPGPYPKGALRQSKLVAPEKYHEKSFSEKINSKF
jgi:hypothetical protein